MFKHFLFKAGKTAHLDRLCLEISSTTVGPNAVDCLSVCCEENLLRLRNKNVLLLSLLQIMLKKKKQK